MNVEDEIRRLWERVGRLERELAARPSPRPAASPAERTAAPATVPDDILVWRIWEEVVHGGLPGGSRPRGTCCDIVAVLSARGLPAEAARDPLIKWLVSRKSAAPPKLDYFARDLASLLDKPKFTPVPARSQYDNPEADRQMREDLARDLGVGRSKAPVSLSEAIANLDAPEDDPADAIASWRATEGLPARSEDA